MSYTHVATAAWAGGSSGGTTSGIDTTGADILVVSVTSWASAGAPTLTDSKGNSYGAAAVTISGADVRVQVYYLYAPTVGSGHTFTVSGSGSTYSSVSAEAFSGAATSPFNTSSTGAVGGGVSTVQPGSITPSEDNCLVLSAVGWNLDSTVSIDGGFSTPTVADPVSAQSFGSASSYLIQTTAGAANPTWTKFAGTYVYAAAAILSFKASAGGITATSTATIATTGSAAGTVAIAAASAATLAVSGSAAAAVGIAAASAATLPLTGSATGTTVNAATGASAATLTLGATSAGTVAVAGHSALSLPVLASSAAQINIGAASAATIAMAGTAAGVVGNVPVIGDSAATLGISGAAAGTVAVGGYSAVTLPVLAASAGQIVIAGASGRTLGISGAASGVVGDAVVVTLLELVDLDSRVTLAVDLDSRVTLAVDLDSRTDLSEV